MPSNHELATEAEKLGLGGALEGGRAIMLKPKFTVPVLKEVDHDAWFCQRVCVSIESVSAGNLIPAADVEVKFAVRRALARSQHEGTRLGPGPD